MHREREREGEGGEKQQMHTLLKIFGYGELKARRKYICIERGRERERRRRMRRMKNKFVWLQIHKETHTLGWGE